MGENPLITQICHASQACALLRISDMARTGISRLPGSTATLPAVPRRLMMAVAVGLTCLVVVLLFSRARSTGEARIESLSAAQRLELYERTLADLELCAGNAGAALSDHCMHQAKLAVKFSECDAHCKELASPWQTLPSR